MTYLVYCCSSSVLSVLTHTDTQTHTKLKSFRSHNKISTITIIISLNIFLIHPIQGTSVVYITIYFISTLYIQCTIKIRLCSYLFSSSHPFMKYPFNINHTFCRRFDSCFWEFICYQIVVVIFTVIC